MLATGAAGVFRFARRPRRGKRASMILDCPECHARYLVPDSAIGVSGRTVRCANCRHSWFQTLPGDAAAPPPEAPATAPVIGSTPKPAAATATFVDPAVETPARDYDAFAHRPPFRPRRNVTRVRTVAAIAAGLLMLVTIGIILWTTAPGLAQQVGLSIGPDAVQLRIVDNPIERRKMTNGSELFAISGQITNPSAAQQRVPDIRADLRDAQGKIVFSWTISPQQRTLGPRAALDFNSAQVDVPANSKRLDLSFVGETS